MLLRLLLFGDTNSNSKLYFAKMSLTEFILAIGPQRMYTDLSFAGNIAIFGELRIPATSGLTYCQKLPSISITGV
ncbi:hypothetical protein E5288_WYG006127 [Bos mutus]|uniref:Uncharacterized protein n=1 Tax=Bos mutus TaxID=72004 RepID=A0A6B0QYF2_9CETA|nr:hypothetical protein [Bos mutus]